jgi:hypothetical protein
VREREIRQAVRRLSGCLDALERAQRRVLRMRAGLGDRPARSRREVARRLDTSLDRVRRLERRGLRNARMEARTDGCGPAGAGAAAPGPDGIGGLLAAGAAGPPSPERILAVADDGPADDAPIEGAGVGGGAPGGVGSAEEGDVRSESESRLPGLPAGPGAIDGGTSVGVALGLILLALAAGFATPSLREHLRSR